MDFIVKKLENMTVYYFGKEEKATISIIEVDPQIQFTCNDCGKKVSIFTALWHNKIDLNQLLQAEMEHLQKGTISGVRCLDCSNVYAQNNYQNFYKILLQEKENSPRKISALKSMANFKAAQLLIKWFDENFSK
ncbi:MAG: hypothetical protein PHV06_07745 [bacterium]|nr:hypothetical protein [bacterium]